MSVRVHQLASRARARLLAALLVLTFGLIAPAVRAQQAQTGPESPDAKHGDELFEQAMEFAGRGRFPDALRPAEAAIPFLERAYGPDARELIDPLQLFANMRRDTYDPKTAEPVYQRALALSERWTGAESLETATLLNNLGVLYRVLGQFGKAIPVYERALAIRRKVLGPTHEDTAQLMLNLSIVMREVGDYARSRALLEQSIDIYRRVYGDEDPATGQAFGMLAAFQAHLGNYAEAERWYRRAYDVHLKTLTLENKTTLVSLNNLGFHYRTVGAYDKAEPLLVQALAEREKLFGPDNPDVANSIGNLAALYVAEGKLDRARELFERTLAINERLYGVDSLRAADVDVQIANVDALSGNLARAEDLDRRALAIREKELGLENPQVSQLLVAIANVRLARHDPAGARPLLERAVAVDYRLLGPNHPLTASALTTLAELQWANGRIDDAIDAQRNANDARERELLQNLTVGSETRKLSYLELTAAELDRTISLHQKAAPDNPTAARTALEIILRRKGRSLDAMTGQIEALRRRATPEDSALLSDLAIARAEYARTALAGSGGQPPAQSRDDVERLSRRIDELESAAAERSAPLAASAVPVTLDAVRECIPDQAALVEYAIYRPYDPATHAYGPRRYTAYLLTRQGEIRWADLGPVDAIDALVRRLRERIRAQAPERDVRGAARALDEAVMRPVRRLGADRFTRLLVAPDGTLNLVPFAGLVDERGRYLVERQDIVYLTSGRDLIRLRQGVAPQKSGAPEIVANPDFGAANPAHAPALRFRPLPGTELEAADISRLFAGATVLTGAEATEGAVRRVSAPSILHIATHGFFLGVERETAAVTASRTRWETMREIVQISSPATAAPGEVLAAARDPLLRSGLGLAGANAGSDGGSDDGLLTALEAAGLDLWGTELVVLSACDTGVGETSAGNGVYGLRRALTLAGAEAQLSSLWSVSDRGTRELMAAYYHALLAGEGRSDALRATQLAMLKDPRRRHPFYWAGFIPSGAWWPLSSVTHTAAR